MRHLLPDLLLESARRTPESEALRYRGEGLGYAALARCVEHAGRGLLDLGIGRGERVAVYLEKRLETVIAFYAAAWAGAAFVPINPILKPRQVAHILRDCNVRILVTSASRQALLAEQLASCGDLDHVVLVDAPPEPARPRPYAITTWEQLVRSGDAADRPRHRVIDLDMAAILYTSGSTGKPKGVVLSHRNLVVGAESVSHYLRNDRSDRILSVLPLSFDAGLSQVTTGLCVGATVVLMNYLLPRDILKTLAAEAITGLTGVPPLWIQLAQLDWPHAAVEQLRYIANTGGAMPTATLRRLRAALPETDVYLMYGLTEAFRSTYLPPSEVDRRPESIGQAIPNAEILVLRDDGTLCGANEPGELVHRGALVALGYWNNPEATAERFRPAPRRPGELSLPEIAVWSGDTVRRDEDGFFYFIGRRDDMIKTSGFRVSPSEVEEVVYASGLVGEAAALGVAHPMLGQAVVVAAAANGHAELEPEAVLAHCRKELPAYMVPLSIVPRPSLPRNPNGKVDRKKLADELKDMFVQDQS